MKNKYIKNIIFFGIILRLGLYIANLFVGGFSLDEAMLFLNARSISDYGVDISGQHLPMYFDTWIFGGQSPLPTYLSALFIKVVGYSVAISRLPALIMSCVGFASFCIFATDFFKEDKLKYISTILCAISPFGLYSAIAVLDCYYMPHIMSLGMCILQKGINNSKKWQMALSMVFFGLTFYCYISSIFVVPLFLLVLYLILLKDKRITISDTVVSVLSLTIVSLPFIIFGLVLIGAIQPIEIFGFTFDDMRGYARSSDLSILAGSFGEILKVMLSSLGSGLLYVGFNDVCNLSVFMGAFSFSNCLGGLFAIAGMIVAFSSIKRLESTQRGLLIAFAIIIFFYISMICNNNVLVTYRYCPLYYILLIFEAYGLDKLFGILPSKKSYYTNLVIYCLCSLTVFCYVFNRGYIRAIDVNSAYEDNIYNAIEYAESKTDRITLVDQQEFDLVAANNNSALALAAMSYYYDKVEFNSITDYFANRGAYATQTLDKFEDYDLVNDERISLVHEFGDVPEGSTVVTLLSNTEDLDKNDYTIKQFGCWCVVTEK